MASVIIVHGLGGSSKGDWLPWLKGELEKLGCGVIVPDFPHSNTPKLDEWLTELHGHNRQIDGNTIIIGHSLGCAFILNALELRNSPIKSAFLVAGFAGSLADAELNSLVKEFLDKDFDWEKVRSNCKKFYVINSDNDPYVPLDNAYQLALNLAVEVNVVKGARHFNCSYIPELLEMIKKEL